MPPPPPPYPLGRAVSATGGAGIFRPISYKQLTFYFPVFIIHENLIKIYAIVPKFRLLDYVILLHATILGIA